ncbi:TPA: hypothetical protein QDB15_006418 [Burkholderia vietnamiensis]|uniref:hypothetical protein n=1 Tax=Burkholderia vietnamiensis TaxID=60552 RepID=UPI0009BD5EBB|nr:hypothetical protein [Burkholderia vietnamiensis]MCA8211980.1 hypothetical protein [Burkholderia vietnamiensis]HDR9102709.1 hypothetical protein [Burkholderia vietnamiensis]HDR9122525.1 hypothetical protein [Burkholderia vietnamiensis]HDR9172287.1 hypothetical protein [Burkholderia vietnamiensis]HDR9284634.1 hypothetical protein [Burkholderia vietnamiensis]
MNVYTFEPKTSVKVVGASGQISLGKENAGHQVQIEQREPGVWVVRTVVVVPQNELWVHEPRVQRKLQNAIAWAQENRPVETDPDALFERLLNAAEQQQSSGGPE